MASSIWPSASHNDMVLPRWTRYTPRQLCYSVRMSSSQPRTQASLFIGWMDSTLCTSHHSRPLDCCGRRTSDCALVFSARGRFAMRRFRVTAPGCAVCGRLLLMHNRLRAGRRSSRYCSRSNGGPGMNVIGTLPGNLHRSLGIVVATGQQAGCRRYGQQENWLAHQPSL